MNEKDVSNLATLLPPDKTFKNPLNAIPEIKKRYLENPSVIHTTIFKNGIVKVISVSYSEYIDKAKRKSNGYNLGRRQRKISF